MELTTQSVRLITPEEEIMRQLAEIERIARVCTDTEPSNEVNWGLIYRMFSSKHMSVFYHSAITFEIVCPLCIAKQILRHQAGTPTTEYTEMSMRYVNMGDKDIKFHVPAGAIGEIDYIKGMFERQEADYKYLVSKKVRPEFARSALGAYASTRVVKTFNIPALHKFLKERMHRTAQLEIQEVAIKMLSLLPSKMKGLYDLD